LAILLIHNGKSINPPLMKKIYVALTLFLLAGSSALHAQTTFNYTGAVQTYTVPPCVNSISVTVLGAQGGNGSTAPGGLGGSVQATIPVTPGEVLNIYVGQTGADNTGNGPTSFNGGGSTFSYSSGGTAGSGGGASDIRRAPYSTADRLVVAGGGGGGGYQNCNGGHGGGLTGQDGIPFPSWPNAGGKGGTQTFGGAGGIACCSCPTYTTSGVFFQGGNGSGDGAGGGGGGGGYYGGGGACFSGGGGGSSYTDPSATGVTHAQGVRANDGQVIITPGPTSAPPSPSSITGTNNFCANSTTTFSISAVVGATSYTWTVPSGATINSGQGTTSINVTFGSSSGTVSVTADNSCGSSAATTLAVTVNPAPTVTANTTASVICAGDAVTLSGGGAATYSWSHSVTDNVAFNPSTTATYTVTGTDVNGCTNTAPVTVTVNPLPNVTATTTASVICAGDVVTLSGGGATSYAWSHSVTDNVAFEPVATATYTVTGTDGNSCTNTATVSVTVNPLPTVTVSFPMDTVCFTGGMVMLSGESPAGGTWSGTGVTGNSFDPVIAGLGWEMINYSYTDGNNCTNSINDSLNVDVCADVITLPALNNISVYPNPNSGTFAIALNSAVSDLVIVITDMQGRVVYSVIENNAQAGYIKQIELETASSGLYFVSITANGEQRIEKISVQK
jgi:hypothetical protein